MFMTHMHFYCSKSIMKNNMKFCLFKCQDKVKCKVYNREKPSKDKMHLLVIHNFEMQLNQGKIYLKFFFLNRRIVSYVAEKS